MDEKLEKIWNVLATRNTDPAERPEVVAAGKRFAKMVATPVTYAEAQVWLARGEGWNYGVRQPYTLEIVKHADAVAQCQAWQARVDAARKAQQELTHVQL